MDAAWERLVQVLPGTWNATGELAGLVIAYRVVSRGSALLETFGAAEDRQRALALGANAYITKPIQAPQVIKLVKETLGITDEPR